MYQQRFGLNGLPFRLSPDPANHFPASGHSAPSQALQQVQHGQGGLTVLTGAAGSGKTLLLMRLLAALPKTSAVARFHQGPTALREVLDGLLRQLHGITRSSDAQSTSHALSTLLQERERAGQHTVIAIDNAHLCPDRTLTGLLQHTVLQHRPLDLVLTGDETLRQRISACVQGPAQPLRWQAATVGALTADEIEPYLQHRLDQAGARGRAFFDRPASQLIMRMSDGLPKIINRLADGGMTIAHDALRDIVRAEDLLAAARFIGTVDASYARRAASIPTPASVPTDDGSVDLEATRGDLADVVPRALRPTAPETTEVTPISAYRDTARRPPSGETLRTVCRIHLQLHGVVLQSIDLTSGSCAIGRSRRNDLPVPSRYISRTHCRISRAADRVLIEDLNSTNGLMLRGERIRFGSLCHGDVVAMGVHELRIEIVALSD
jgi:MSHA biogenesis protein MshM